MEKTKKEKITVETRVHAPMDKVWSFWNGPEHVMQWNSASDDWHTPKAENDPRPGGKFVYRMEAKDGSFGFDFGGVYGEVIPNKYIEYTLGDGRKVKVNFETTGNQTTITEDFDAESQNPVEMQRGGWQAIIDNFRKYTENN